MSMIEQAIEAAGGVSALASKIGVKPPTVSQWRSGTRPVPPRLAPAVEQATDGVVTRHDLRPDVFGPAPVEPAHEVVVVAAAVATESPPCEPCTKPLNTPEAVAAALAKRGVEVQTEGAAPRAPVPPQDPDADRVVPFEEIP